MAVDIKTHLAELMRCALTSALPDKAESPIAFERPKHSSHGDFSCNLAMQLARLQKRNPREIAQLLISAIPPSLFVEKIEVAGTGFINFYLKTATKLEVIRDILKKKESFGRSDIGQNQKLQIEFVSANPTGPLHVGHGRGAAYGASLANLMAFAGWDVTREYYVNDAGRQMDILTLSAWLRYLDLQGENIPFPPNGYHGNYVRDMAMGIKIAARGNPFVFPVATVGKDLPPLPNSTHTDDEALAMREAYLDALIARAKMLLGESWNYIHDHALKAQLSDCQNDLEEFGVCFDVWFSETALFGAGLVEHCVNELKEAGHLYEQDGAKWFRSTAFGDEKDRVVQRDNGLYTYFAADLAYHLNKYDRGFDRIINVWGADHHGYIARMKGALEALGRNPGALDIALVQFAVLYRNGQKTSMSTRAGEFVTLRSLRNEVGNDACRFFYILRKSDQHLDFDLDLATTKTNENPVYYIQYAHARICSVLAQWGEDPYAYTNLTEISLACLGTSHELDLVVRLAEFPEIVELASKELSPHMIAFYLKDLASDFHSYYNAERLLVDNENLKNARMALIFAIRQVIRTGLDLIGVSYPSSM